MSYIIRKAGSGQYVQNAGSNKSYTRTMRQPDSVDTARANNIRLFDDEASAKRNCCGNEYVVSLNV